MYVTMSIAFRLLIAASNIAVLFNARPLPRPDRSHAIVIGCGSF